MNRELHHQICGLKRMRLLWCLAVPAILFAYCSSTVAEDSSWQRSFDEATAAFDSGELDTAKQKCEEALKSADEAREIEPGVVTCMTKLSLINEKLGNPQESERLYELAMRTLEAQAGRESVRFADFMPDLAYLYEAHNKPAKAEVLFKKAIQIKEKAFGEDDIRVAVACEDYAHFLEKENRKTESTQLMAKARSIRGKQ